MKENCIVNVATGLYVKGQNRLKESLQKNGFDGDLLFWTDELPKGSLTHEISPMGYKPIAMEIAVQAGYKNILWLDANMIVVRNLSKIFNSIACKGYYVFTYGSIFGEWCSDIALTEFNISRQTSFTLLELNTSCVGINAESKTGKKFLRDWSNYALDGKTFRGIPNTYSFERTNDNKDLQLSKDTRVKGHRHDQTAASFLAWKYKMKISMCELLNYQSKDENGNNVYSKAIPFDTLILQNRDTKTESYLESVNKYGNTKRLRRVKFLFLSLILTILRKYRYIKIVKKYQLCQ